MNQKRVLWWGRFDPGYSRNRVYISLFKELGWAVDFFFVKLWPKFGDVEAFFRGPKARPDLVWVPVCRQRDILAACRWAHRRGIPVIFDPMLTSRSKVELRDRAIGNLALIAEAGVTVAITTDHPVVPIDQLRLQAILAVREGLPPETALRALTVNPAAILALLSDLYTRIWELEQENARLREQVASQ